MKTRILLGALLALLLSVPATAQQTTATIQAIDPSTSATVSSVGDASNNAVRVNAINASFLVQGLVAHDAVYSGNPLPTGCYASASAPSDVSADGDIARVWCLRNGAISVNITNTSIAITAAALPLPTGAATASNQSTANASLSSIDGKTPALGQALAAGSVPVVLTGSQLSTLTPPAAITGFATESTLSSLNGKVTAVNTGAVVVSSSALPTGAATAAKQPALGTAGSASSDVLTVQGIASMTALKVDGSAVTQPVSVASIPSHNVTNAGTFAVQASQSGTWTVQPGNTANTTAWLVTGTGGTFPATQSGTWTVQPGNTANTTPWLTTIAQGGNSATVNGSGQLSVTCANCSGSGVSVLEDAASANGDAGTPAYSVRQDTPAGSTSADGDYQPLKTDSVGRLWVNCGTGCAGGTQYAEDSARSSGDTVTLAGAVRQDTLTSDTSSDGDASFLKVTSAGRLYVDSAVTSSTLPTGAATAAKQPALGTAGSASSDVITIQGIASMTAVKTDGSGVTQPVSGTVTVTQSTATNLKAQAEAYQGGSAVGSGNPLQVTLANTGANATAVKVDGSAVTQPISASSLPLPTGASTAANQSTGNASLASLTGSLTGASSATLANVSSATSSATCLASNSARKMAVVYNDSTEILYLKFGSSASSTSFTYFLPAGATWEMPMPVYTGAITCIWADANGAARVTEW